MKSLKPAGRPLTEPTEPSRYLDELRDCFGRARERLGAENVDLLIAGRALRLSFAGSPMREALAPAFAHLPAPNPGVEPELTIEIWDGESPGIEPPPIPWDREDLRELGQVDGFDEGSIRTVCDLRYGAITVVDLDRRSAVFQVPAAARMPWYERAAPLRPALHWLLAKGGPGLIHAGAVGRDARGLLLAGRGGSGKSTLATAALLRGLDFGGDDYMALTLDGAPTAHSVHATAKLTDRSLALLPGLTEPVIASGGDPEAKNVIDVWGWQPGSVRPAMTLEGVVIPRIGSETRCTPISGAGALLALAPSTLFQLPGRDRASLGEMADLARAVPAYELELAGDPDAGAGVLEELLSGGG